MRKSIVVTSIPLFTAGVQLCRVIFCTGTETTAAEAARGGTPREMRRGVSLRAL